MDENHEIVDSDNQKKKRKKKERILSLFPHHVIPDNLSLISLYELLVYIAVFLCLLNWYECFHSIQEYDHDIYIDSLDSLRGNRRTKDFAEIKYHLLGDSTREDFYYKFERLSSEREITKWASRSGRLDSLKKNYLRLLPDSAQSDCHLFYLKATWPENPKSKVQGGDLDSLVDGGYYQYGKTSIDPKGFLVIEDYFSFPPRLGFQGENTLNMQPPWGYGTPRFWSRRDITQGYYTVRVHTQSMDSILLTYQFGGAVDIAALGDVQPDIISGDRIVYRFIPNHYDVTTLRFHAKYRDMENKQNRRVFLVTAFMSAILTIFLAFLIIYVYRILLEPIVRKRNAQKEEKNKTTSS